MDIIQICLILLSAVVLSQIIARAFRSLIPTPIIQIVIGVLIAKYTAYEVTLDPAVFFALFIPLLLFLDGWRIPKDDLRKDAGTVIELAVGLVFLTVVGLGFVIYLMIPTMPLPIAFALAAMLAPTDPVAVSAITSKLKMPKRLHHILEGEALLNDASGLSAFRIAVAVMVTGHFSLMEAATEFSKMAFGGALIGTLLTIMILWVKNAITRRYGEEMHVTTLILFLIPFSVYFATELFHFSGVLAAAAAGITMGFMESRGRTTAATRLSQNTVWDMVSFCANGVIFVLLGEQFPKIWESASTAMAAAGGGHKSWLIVYVLVITAILLGMRFAWVWVSFRFTTFRRKRKGEEVPEMSWRIPAVATFAGVRGSITLAGIMTLPVMLSPGVPMPGRDLAVLLASGVILTTMVLASLTLPILLKGLKVPEEDYEKKLRMARGLTARAAVRAIEAKAHEMAEGRADAAIYTEAAARVMALYEMRVTAEDEDIDAGEEAREIEKIERKLRLTGVAAEREKAKALKQGKRVPEAVSNMMTRDIDFKEARLLGL